MNANIKVVEYFNTFIRERQFCRFDIFIIRDMGMKVQSEKIDDEVRRAAFLEFRKRTGRQDIASLPTIRRWFGIGGFHKPSREQVYRMCFAMHLSVQKSEEYFTKGIYEPAFQVNDYQEMIFLYGLENGKSFAFCNEMADRFEEGLEEEFCTKKVGNTEELKRQFETHKGENPDEFLAWMMEHADDFKGYSQTVFDYLQLYKKKVLVNVRREEKKRLEELLSETHYQNWCRKQGKEENDFSKNSIAEFLDQSRKSQNSKISEHLRNMVWELTKDMNSEKLTNVKMISEGFTGMTEKYLSDLFRIPEHREYAMRLKKAVRTIEKMDDTETCPEWIIHLLEGVVDGKKGHQTVGEIREPLRSYTKEFKRRCLLVQREDLLPLIFTGACQEYTWDHPLEYSRSQARELFVKYANATLGACNMPALHEEYRLDALLLACFSEKEMYSYGDVLRWEKSSKRTV